MRIGAFAFQIMRQMDNPKLPEPRCLDESDERNRRQSRGFSQPFVDGLARQARSRTLRRQK